MFDRSANIRILITAKSIGKKIRISSGLAPVRDWVSRLVLLLFVLASASANAQTESTSYELSPGDSFRIYVVGEPDLSVELTVNDEGEVFYPLLGRMVVSGKTDSDLEAMFAERLSGDYLVEPEISVHITGYRKFYLEGEVQNPGPYQYVPGLTVRQAIALAGGFTELASRKKIYRFSEDSGNRKKKKVSLGDTVSPGDVIEVDESWF